MSDMARMLSVLLLTFVAGAHARELSQVLVERPALTQIPAPQATPALMVAPTSPVAQPGAYIMPQQAVASAAPVQPTLAEPYPFAAQPAALAAPAQPARGAVGPTAPVAPADPSAAADAAVPAVAAPGVAPMGAATGPALAAPAGLAARGALGAFPGPQAGPDLSQLPQQMGPDAAAIAAHGAALGVRAAGAVPGLPGLGLAGLGAGAGTGELPNMYQATPSAPLTPDDVLLKVTLANSKQQLLPAANFLRATLAGLSGTPIDNVYYYDWKDAAAGPGPRIEVTLLFKNTQMVAKTRQTRAFNDPNQMRGLSAALARAGLSPLSMRAAVAVGGGLDTKKAANAGFIDETASSQPRGGAAGALSGLGAASAAQQQGDAAAGTTGDTGRPASRVRATPAAAADNGATSAGRARALVSALVAAAVMAAVL